MILGEAGFNLPPIAVCRKKDVLLNSFSELSPWILPPDFPFPFYAEFGR